MKISVLTLLLVTLVATTANAYRCFPRNFLMGTATAAIQVEGGHDNVGQGLTVWDKMCRLYPQYLKCANVADDFVHRFKDDIALMAKDGHTAFRFSFSWARAMRWDASAKAMKPNPAGIQYYHMLIDELKRNHIEPVVTLFHFDTPEEFLTELPQVAWVDPSIVDHFEQYATLMFHEFGKKVKFWSTINEPLSFCYIGGGELYDPTTGYVVGHHLLVAHGTAVHRFRQLKKTGIIRPDARIAMVLNYDNVYPRNPKDPKDIAAAKRQEDFALGWWAEPLVKGDYPAIMRQIAGDALPKFTENERALVKGSYDLFMLNHYGSLVVTDCDSPLSATNCSALPQGVIRDIGTDQNFYPGSRLASVGNPLCGFNGYPQGYRDTIKVMHAYDPKAEILLTENGWCGNSTIDNKDQLWYYQTHLDEVYKSMTEDHIPIIGYLAWSFMDNYEYGSYDKRFGLYYVNFTSNVGAVDEVTPGNEWLQRIPRTAAKWYANVTTHKCLP